MKAFHIILFVGSSSLDFAGSLIWIIGFAHCVGCQLSNTPQTLLLACFVVQVSTVSSEDVVFEAQKPSRV
ncbi:hypothetical protein GYMLUDRAFT_47898 [Collybiopsis luxurians FD-317 M1]|uniref:Uncharacterized protein n=1 Tax=Collybiopsis luxurians FD-317 M1 TaxID=944289 RepID=A0A0D0AXI1_9AGAR|nr:hypothetical protein GYMLUDRAFT_47898 [Collybiopsis luxurians FD-317 M1]